MSQRKPQSRRQKPAEMPETENDRIAGRNPVMEALRSGARIDMLYVGQESGGLQEIISLAKEQGIPVKVVTESKLTQLTGGAVHQGVAAEGACGTYVSLEELLQKNPEICIVTNELGYGVVPIEPFDRKWREKTGRICTELAAKADSVTRVVCGIGILLKGEEKHD